jgi:hypothetical protein
MELAQKESPRISMSTSWFPSPSRNALEGIHTQKKSYVPQTLKEKVLDKKTIEKKKKLQSRESPILVFHLIVNSSGVI